MTKTTVYLSDDIKLSLTRMSVFTGRSEADLIREAVATLLESLQPPRPRGGLWESGDGRSSERVDEHLRGFGG